MKRKWWIDAAWIGATVAALALLSGCTEGEAESESITPPAVTVDPDGAFDTNFGAGGYVALTGPIEPGNNRGYALHVLSNGKIVISGDVFNGTGFDVAVWQVMPAGVPDAAFGSDGFTTNNNPTALNDGGFGVTVDSSGEIVVAGQRYVSGIYSTAFWTFRSNGIFDGVLSSGGPGAGNDSGTGILIDSNGMFLISGTGDAGANGTDLVINRFLNDYTGPDTANFNSPDGFYNIDGGDSLGDSGNAVAVDSSGDVYTTGQISSGATLRMGILKVDGVDGSPVPGFGTGGLANNVGSGAPASGRAIAVQSSGRIVVAGESYSGADLTATLWGIQASTGALDTTFGTNGRTTLDEVGGAGDDQLWGMIIDKKGRLVVVGTTLSQTEMFVARFSKNGGLDASFGNSGVLMEGGLSGGTSVNGVAIAEGKDGAYYVAGWANFAGSEDTVLWKIK